MIHISVAFGLRPATGTRTLLFEKRKIMRGLCSVIAVVSLLSAAGAKAGSPPPPAAAQAAPAAMQTFSSVDGRFSVLFPGVPQSKSDDLGNSITLFGSFVDLDDGDVRYEVDYADYPASLIASKGTPEAVLELLRDSDANGETIVSDSAIDLNGVPGRAFTVVDQTGDTTTKHLFLAGNRVYQLMVDCLHNKKAPMADQFMNSFRLQ